MDTVINVDMNTTVPQVGPDSEYEKKVREEVQKNRTFEVDWKFSIEDVIWFAKMLVDDLPIDYSGEKQVNGDWVEALLVKGKEIQIKMDSDDRLYKIIELLNSNIPDQSVEFALYDTEGDSYGFELVSK